MPDYRRAWHLGAPVSLIVNLLRRGRTSCPREDMRRNTLRYCALRAAMRGVRGDHPSSDETRPYQSGGGFAVFHLPPVGRRRVLSRRPDGKICGYVRTCGAIRFAIAPYVPRCAGFAEDCAAPPAKISWHRNETKRRNATLGSRGW
jgi:hypothetical protein